MKQKSDPSKRFWAKVNKSGDCWTWNAYRLPAGYGYFKLNGKNKLAHRFAYEESKGPIPNGLTLDHKCKNTCCVNPEHLEAITLSENVKRAEPWKKTNPGAYNKTKTHCKNGHPYDSINTYITPTGRRDCKLCRRAACRKNYRKTP
jgi:hypothetical protein